MRKLNVLTNMPEILAIGCFDETSWVVRSRIDTVQVGTIRLCALV